MNDIDVLMATYNGASYIDEQIKSIKNQTFKNWKLFIRDDGSTDETLNIIESEIIGWEDKIVLIHSDKEIDGISGNFYELLKISKAQYITFSDQDDVWLKCKLEILYNKCLLLEKENSDITPVLVHSDLKVVDSDLNKISDSFFKSQIMKPERDSIRQLLVQNIVTGCTVLMNRQLKDLIMPFHKDMVMHDWWIALIAGISGVIGFIPEPLILYRQHGGNSVGASKNFLTDFKREIKRVLYPKKYNNYKLFIRQAEAVNLHLLSKNISNNNMKVLSSFISISSKNSLYKFFLMIFGRFLIFPLFRNFYLLRI